MTDNDVLNLLAAAWREAKREEGEARDRRLEIEKKILSLVPPKEEGTVSLPLADGVLKTVGKLNFKVDIDRLRAIVCRWPTDEQPVRWVAEPDDARLRAIRRGNPERWAQIAPAVTVTPAKTTISVTEF